jgi:hypothetical protein
MTTLPDATTIYAQRRLQAAPERAAQPPGAYGTGKPLPEPAVVYAARQAQVAAAAGE